MLIRTALSFIAAAASAPALAAECPTTVDQSQMQFDYATFDAAGWRDLLAKGCVDAAVALLESYRTANESRLQPAEVRELHFHVGQALAFGGRDEESVPHFEAARGGGEEWSAYVEATLAFLKRDAAALSAARERYAKAPSASKMRLAVIDGFVKCADKSYAQAVHCGMGH